MNKPRRYPRPLAEFVGLCLADAFARRGFAATEIVTHWDDIVGPEIAAHAEPMKIQWPGPKNVDADAATLLLRVEGPAAIEIQHLAGVIVERVNRFFGWPAIGRIALRQAPLARRKKRRTPPAPDPELAKAISAGMTDISDENLRAALGRLGAAIKGK
jgi:hypothetical protein